MVLMMLIVVLCLVVSGGLGFYLDRAADQAERNLQEVERVLGLDTHLYPVRRRQSMFHRKHKPSLAELEARSHQMEEAALLTPESIWADNERWIQETDRLLGNAPPEPYIGDPGSWRRQPKSVYESINRRKVMRSDDGIHIYHVDDLDQQAKIEAIQQAIQSFYSMSPVTVGELHPEVVILPAAYNYHEGIITRGSSRGDHHEGIPTASARSVMRTVTSAITRSYPNESSRQVPEGTGVSAGTG